MIASLSGKITYKSPELRKDSYLVIDVGGVGYKVYMPQSNLKKIKEEDEIIIYTYLSVSERAMDLYGFLDPADKTFFILLLEVPGIGPKSAISILDKTTMSEVQQAILNDDSTVLTKMSGLGEKTADKIIVTLKSKVEKLTSGSKGKKTEDKNSADSDAFDALVSFGYSAAESRKALSQVNDKIIESSKKLREALRILGKKNK